MPSNTGALIGGRGMRITLDWAETDTPGNRTRWTWAAEFLNTGGVSGDGNYWAMAGFATSGGALPFYIPPGSSTILLGSGTFWKTHSPDGTLAPPHTLTLYINSDNPFVGSGEVSVAVTPPRIPRGPRVRHGGTWKPTVAYVRHGGTWKPAVAYVRHGGTWKVSGS